MQIDDSSQAKQLLSRINYYRLSGYWYPMRRFDSNRALDTFQDGVSFNDVISLYRFDERVRHIVFAELSPIETAFRALLGHELGRIDQFIYLDEKALGQPAARQERNRRTVHENWLARYHSALDTAKEDFVEHYKKEILWSAAHLGSG